MIGGYCGPYRTRTCYMEDVYGTIYYEAISNRS